ncbi:hypothetical protein PENTCL1PPCAC_17869, partial [Pristionchus entomophagus]
KHVESLEDEIKAPTAVKEYNSDLYDDVNGISIEIVEPNESLDDRTDSSYTVSSVETIVTRDPVQGRRGSLMKAHSIDYDDDIEISDEERPRRGSVLVSSVDSVASQIRIGQAIEIDPIHETATVSSSVPSISHSISVSSALPSTHITTISSSNQQYSSSSSPTPLFSHSQPQSAINISFALSMDEQSSFTHPLHQSSSSDVLETSDTHIRSAHDSSHCTLHLETTVSSPVLLVKGSMETHHVSDDVILIRQFDHAPSPIKDIHLLTSAIDPSIEAALTLTEWKEAETYSSFASCITFEKGELRATREEIHTSLSPPIDVPIKEEFIVENEESSSQSSEEGMFEEYWEEVVVQHYEEEIRRTQEKRLQLLKRIEDTRRINERTFERRYSYGERRSYDRISMDSPFSLRTIDSPYSFNSRTVDSPGGRSITSIREEKEDENTVSHEDIQENREESVMENFEKINEMKESEEQEENVHVDDYEHRNEGVTYEEEKKDEWREEMAYMGRVNAIEQMEDIIHLKRMSTQGTEKTEQITQLEERRISSDSEYLNSQEMIEQERSEERLIIGQEESEERIYDEVHENEILMREEIEEETTAKSEVKMEEIHHSTIHENEEMNKTWIESGERREEQDGHEISIGMERDSSHLYVEISEEVIYDRVASQYDQVRREEDIYEEIDDYFEHKREDTIEKYEAVRPTDSTSATQIDLSRKRTYHGEDSGEYTEIVVKKEEIILEKVKLLEAIDIVDNTLSISIPREPLPIPRRGRGSFVEMMAHVWDARLIREQEKRMSPRKMFAPRRKDFEAGEYLTDVIDEELMIRPADLDSASIRASVRPRSHSVGSSSFHRDIDTPSIKTIRYDPIEGRRERIKMELDDFYIGDVTIITNDGIRLTEKNAYARNEYEEIKDEVVLSPQLESESKRTHQCIRVASKTNRWREEEDEHSMRHVERYHSLDRKSSLSSPTISHSPSHSRKKSVTFAPPSKLIDYCDMREYSLREEYGNTRIEPVEHQSNGVTLIQAEDSFTRKETSNGQSLTRHYERSEKRERINPWNSALNNDSDYPINQPHQVYRSEWKESPRSPHPSPVFSPQYYTHSFTSNNSNNNNNTNGKVVYGSSIDRPSTVSESGSVHRSQSIASSRSSIESHKTIDVSPSPIVKEAALHVQSLPHSPPSIPSSPHPHPSPSHSLYQSIGSPTLRSKDLIYDSVPVESSLSTSGIVPFANSRRTSIDSTKSNVSLASTTSTLTSRKGDHPSTQSDSTAGKEGNVVSGEKTGISNRKNSSNDSSLAITAESLVKSALLVSSQSSYLSLSHSNSFSHPP